MQAQAASLRRSQRRLLRCCCISTSSRHVLDELEARGLVAAVTSRRLRQHLDQQPRSLYLGIDPSAKSLHVGNLLALVGLLHFQLHGHKAIALVGGATGSIGDPSGRSSERTALAEKELNDNVRAITTQLTALCDRGVEFAAKQAGMKPTSSNISFVNNKDWMGNITLLDFLSGPGKQARVSTMLSRESVKTRLESKSGISFTEFSYQLLQAYDFYHLHKHHDCSIQLGGSDQWGNIQSGIDLIRKERLQNTTENAEVTEEADAESPAYGLTLPLLTTSSGEKFGKSAGNALWLDPSLTSPLHLYQFFLRSTDEDVERYLRMFSFQPLEEIESIIKEHRKEPQSGRAQRTLASEVTELVHGSDSVRRARVASSILYGGRPVTSYRADAIIDAFDGPRHIKTVRRDCIGHSFISLCVKYGVIFSKTQAKILLADRGMQINGETIRKNKDELQESDLIDGRVFMLRAGRHNFAVVEVTD